MKKENWSIGKTGREVITDNPDGLLESTGHAGKGAIEYYGGYLICESIWRKRDAALISAAPDLFFALKHLMEGVANLPVLTVLEGVLEEHYKIAEAAIKKATEE
jgi:hypothetical protein